MKKLVLAAITLALLSGPALAEGEYPAIVAGKKLYADNDIRGKQAPKLEVKEWLTGSAPDTRGKVVLIDFWATWCGPCRELIPELNEYQKKFGKDLVVIGISAENADAVKKFMKSHAMKYNVAVDPSDAMSNQIGIKGIPHVILMSPDNVVRWQGFPASGQDDLSDEIIAQVIKASKTN
jgi:cytochrome c biogenesis protein CcmG, thiol:disulfide interchange protein DsbE